MKWFVTSVLALLAASSGSSQKVLLSTIEKYSDKADSKDSILLPIQKNNDLIIGYSRHGTAWDFGTYYYLFALKGKQWKAYQYFQKPYANLGETFYTLDSFPILNSYGDSVLSVFKKSKGWEIKSQNSSSSCPHVDQKDRICIIEDGDNEYLIIITRNYHNTTKFYAPDEYESECCPGWTVRQRYLAIVAPIKSFFRSRR